MSASNRSPETGIEFDREKFLAVLHYIIDECSDDPAKLGKTKLHKCLYYSDMLTFVTTRRPLTGVEYIKAPFGPTARYLDWGLATLKDRGAIDVDKSDYFGLAKFDYESRQRPRAGALSNSETALLREVISFVCERTAREISELSHARPWQSAQMGERIPYSSAFLLIPRSPNERDIEWANDQSSKVKRAG